MRHFVKKKKKILGRYVVGTCKLEGYLNQLELEVPQAGITSSYKDFFFPGQDELRHHCEKCVRVVHIIGWENVLIKHVSTY